MTGHRAVVLDLDGTLVRALDHEGATRGPRCAAEVEILPGTYEALTALRHHYLVLVATNQPDIARGKLEALAHMAVRRRVMDLLPQVAKIYVCPHDGHWCVCRKPAPGLFVAAAVEHELDLGRCWAVGDREQDREAAIRAGIPQTRAIKLETNQGIAAAVQYILEHDHAHPNHN